MNRVAISPHLSQVKEALKREGVEVVDLERTPGSINMEELIAIVASGGDIDFMGMQDIHTGLPVINAEGRTAEEIVFAVKQVEHKRA